MHSEKIHTKEVKVKAINSMRLQLVFACILSGLLAGTNIENYLIRIPAWRKLNILDWAAFSQHSYLSYGFYFYCFISLSCLVLFLSVLFLVYKYNFSHFKWRIIVLALLSGITILFTFFTAPLMFSLPHIGEDALKIKNVFDEVNYWGGFRAIAHVACFILCVFAAGKAFIFKLINNS